MKNNFMSTNTDPNHQLICVGVSHQTAPVPIREKMAFSPHQLQPALTDNPLTELIIISTCNRTEIYAVGSIDTALSFWAEQCGFVLSAMQEHIYACTDQTAVTHLLRVTCGLDSIVLGEPQILGQVIQAHQLAQQNHTAGPILNALFQGAIRCGKRARTETRISHNPASISSIAVHLAQTIQPEIAQSHVAVIGAGEMGQLAVKALKQRGVTQIDVLNRTIANAEELAERLGGCAYTINALPTRLATCDIAITATGAPHPIIDKQMVQAVMAQRPSRPLILIDIALPRDIASEVTDVENVHLFDVDSLKGALTNALAKREAEIPRVEAIIQQESTRLQEKLHTLRVRPLIIELRQKANHIRQNELDRLRKYQPDLDADTWQHIDRMTNALINKLLHEPTQRLRQEVDDPTYAQTVQHLFALGDG